MIEVFQKSEIQRVFDVIVFNVPRENGGKVDCELFVRNSGFEIGLVDRL